MPVYVYRNLVTGETFEFEQRITAAALEHDPVTGDPVRRVIQPVSIAFKGPGFYVTDSRGKKSASAKSKPAERAGAESSSSSAASSDGGAATPPPAASSGASPAAGAASD